MYEAAKQSIKGYLIFLLGASIPILTNSLLLLYWPVFLFGAYFPILSNFLLLLLWPALVLFYFITGVFGILHIIMTIVSVNLVVFGFYYLVREGLFVKANSEVKWLFLTSFCIILVGIGWVIFFWFVSLTPLEWIMASMLYGPGSSRGVIDVGFLQIILGFFIMGKAIHDYRRFSP